MAWPSKLTDDQKNKIIEQYQRNVPVSAIAAEFGVHHSYPTLLARRRKVATRTGLKNKRYLKEIVNEV